MQYINKSFIWYNDDYIYFSVIKMLAIIFGNYTFFFKVCILNGFYKKNKIKINKFINI